MTQNNTKSQGVVVSLHASRRCTESDLYVRDFCENLSYAQVLYALFERVMEQKARSVDIGVPIDSNEADITERIIVQVCSKFGVHLHQIGERIDFLMALKGATTLSTDNPTLIRLLKSGTN